MTGLVAAVTDDCPSPAVSPIDASIEVSEIKETMNKPADEDHDSPPPTPWSSALSSVVSCVPSPSTVWPVGASREVSEIKETMNKPADEDHDSPPLAPWSSALPFAVSVPSLVWPV